MKALAQIFFVTIFVMFFFLQKSNADVCTPVSKPTKYVAKKGDHIAEILRTFKLEPVFGSESTLEKLLKINNLANQNLIQPGDEITLPFGCEEQTNGWRMLDRGEDRIITLEPIDLKTKTSTIVVPQAETKNRAVEIIENDVATGEQVDIESAGAPTEEVSEALRYRMICDGEWTGTECITRYSAIYILGGAWYNRYDGTDATTKGEGTLLSKLNPELGFGWHNYWFENFRTNLGFSYLNNEISPEIRERPIEQRKKGVASVFADARYETGPFGFSLGIAQTEKLFYRFTKEFIVLFDDGGVTVNAVPILSYRGAFSYMFHQAGKYRFDAEIGVSSLQSAATAGYLVDPGTAVDVSLSLQHDRIKEYVFGKIRYEESQQNTQILFQKARELGIEFGYAWKLKDW
ncbi:MAG: LysM peptidoglycan-binding domain-containing protein [Bdellovibrio sp.]|nr:LysM peptidoglycan-binding domain-containing protein [Bdellovibrio sp.]